jgi:hypothetical protein
VQLVQGQGRGRPGRDRRGHRIRRKELQRRGIGDRDADVGHELARRGKDLRRVDRRVDDAEDIARLVEQRAAAVAVPDLAVELDTAGLRRQEERFDLRRRQRREAGPSERSGAALKLATPGAGRSVRSSAMSGCGEAATIRAEILLPSSGVAVRRSQ